MADERGFIGLDRAAAHLSHAAGRSENKRSPCDDGSVGIVAWFRQQVDWRIQLQRCVSCLNCQILF